MNENKEITISFDEPQQSVDITLEEKRVDLNFGESIYIQQTHDHSQLENLDYEHSGHTGFASSQELSVLDNAVGEIQTELSLLDNKYIQKDLSILPSVSLSDNRDNMTIYIDNNGTPSKANLKETLGTLLRLDTQVPDTMQNGEFLMLDLTLKGIQNNNK